MADDQATEVIRARANGAISTILHHKERFVDASLSSDEADRLRRVILREVNGLVGFALEVLHAQGGESAPLVLNEVYLRMIDEMHRAVVLNGAS